MNYFLYQLLCNSSLLICYIATLIPRLLPMLKTGEEPGYEATTQLQTVSYEYKWILGGFLVGSFISRKALV